METKYQQAIFDIRGKLLSGILSYDQAKLEATPVIEEMNRIGKEIAKRFKKKFYPFTFTGLMR